MISTEELQSIRVRTQQYLDRAGIILTAQEAQGIEVADFGVSIA